MTTKFIEFPDDRLKDVLDRPAFSYGKHWAAVRKDQAVSVIPMYTPGNVDFIGFRESAQVLLSTLGEVKAGKVVADADGERWFVEYVSEEELGNVDPQIYKVRGKVSVLEPGTGHSGIDRQPLHNANEIGLQPPVREVQKSSRGIRGVLKHLNLPMG
jgi:hypothetical protein